MKKKNNQFLNLLVNIVIPVLILTKLSKEEYLGPLYGLIVALAFPLFYGLYELIIQKQKNFVSLLGFVGILLTGVIGLLQFPPKWIAIKEAAIPLVIGLVVLFSTKTSWQLISKFLYNREVLNIDKIESKLLENGKQSGLDKALEKANIFLSFSFFLSAALNFILAKIIVTSMPGTLEFNEEIGRMTMLSYPVIVLPSMVILILVFLYLFRSIKKLTGLCSEEVYSENLMKK